MSDKFKISDLQSAKLQELASNVNYIYGDNDKEGNINKKEFKKLQELLNGDSKLKSELAGENDDIKKLFGYTGSVQAAKTSPAADEEVQEEVKAETAQSAKSKDEQLREAYYRYRGIDPISRKALKKDEAGNPVAGLSPKAAFEAVEKAYKDQKEYKDAIKDLKKYSIDAEAKIVVLDAISRTTATDSKQVKKQAEAILKKEGNWDKHTKKALNGNRSSWIGNGLDWLSGQDSDMKLVRKAQAAGNNAKTQASKTHTKEEFTDAIGKECPLFETDAGGVMAIEKLTGTGRTKDINLVTKTADGKYDISKLVEFIGTQVGADNTLNRQQNMAESELEKIRAEFRKQGVELTKRDTKQLVEFCGYRVEKKNLSQAAYNGTLGALAGGLGATVAYGTERLIDELHLDFTLNSQNKGTIELLKTPKLQKMIDEGSLQVIENGTTVKIKVDKRDVQPFFALANQRVALGILKAAGVAAGVGVVAGLLEYGPSEKAAFSANIEPCQSYEDFIAYVDSRKELSAAQKLALKQAAIAYIKEDANGKAVYVTRTDGEGKAVLDDKGEPKKELAWDQKAFIDYLNKSSGFGSNMNKIELYKAVAGAGEIVSNCDCDCDEVTPPKNPSEVHEEDEVCEECETQKKTGTPFEVKPKEVQFRSWQDLVNGYDCLNKPEYKKVINKVALNNRMVKVIQAINVSNVKSEEELKQVYNVKTIAAFAEDAIRLGIDKAIAKHPELPVNKAEYLAVLGATAGLKGNAYVPALYDPDTDDTCEWTKKANAQITKGGSSTATLTRKGHTVDGKTTYWRKCPGGDWEQIDKATYDALQKK